MGRAEDRADNEPDFPGGFSQGSGVSNSNREGLTEDFSRSPSTARKLLAIQKSRSSFMPSPSPANPSPSTTLVLSSLRPKVASAQSVAYTLISAIETMLPAQGASDAADIGWRKSCVAFE